MGHEFEQAPVVGDGKPGVLHAVHGVTKSRTRLSDWTELMACGILAPNQGLNPGPWQRNLRVLTTGPSGNSLLHLLISTPEIPLQRLSVSSPKALPDSGRPSIKAKKCFSKSPKSENGRLDQTAAAIRGHLSMTFPNTSINSPKSMELTFSMSMACALVAVAGLGSPLGECLTSLCSLSYICCMHRLGVFFFFFFCNTSLACFNCLWEKQKSRILVQSTNTGLRSNPGSRYLAEGETCPAKLFPPSKQAETIFNLSIQASWPSGAINIFLPAYCIYFMTAGLIAKKSRNFTFQRG